MSAVVSISTGRKPRPPSAKEAFAAEIDELGLIASRLEPYRRLKAREKALIESIASRYDALPAEQTFEAFGERYGVEISARKSKRSIFNLKALKKLLGEKFLSLVRINLEDIDAHIAASYHPLFLKEELSGNRTVKAFAKTQLEDEKVA